MGSFFKNIAQVFVSIFARRAADRILDEAEERLDLNDEESEAVADALNPFGEEEE